MSQNLIVNIMVSTLKYFKIILLLLLPSFANAELFECKDLTLDKNLWEGENVCFIEPFKNEKVYVLNSQTNTSVNREILFALYEDVSIKSLLRQSSAYQTVRYNLIKLDPVDISNSPIGSYFNDQKEALKKFLQWHELGHLWYALYFDDNIKIQKETFSDIIGALVVKKQMGGDFVDDLKDYRYAKTIERESLNYYTVKGLEKVVSLEEIGDLENIVQKAQKITQSLKDYDYARPYKEKLLKQLNQCDEKKQCMIVYYWAGRLWPEEEIAPLSLSELEKVINSASPLTLKKLTQAKKELLIEMAQYFKDKT